MRLRTLQALTVFAGVLVKLPTTPSNAEPDTSKTNAVPSGNRDSASEVSGKAESQQYWALCQGVDGRGMNSSTDEDAMKKIAAGLTLIAKRNGGVFPFSKVAGTIRDGRGVSGHTPSRMMTWGTIFSADSDPVTATAIVFQLARYVERLQV